MQAKATFHVTFFGSSRFPGEGILDFEEKVCGVTITDCP